ncbi:MAG TPA: PqqD family protein [Casimicrobiaceae bacterium]|nr:PqqD family protein [Casimicrobiaceae bacterium]
MTFDWNATLQRAPGIELREVTDGFVAYDPRRDRLHFLNSTAAMLLESCDGKLRAGELAQLLASAFELQQPPLDEVANCLDRLVAEGLLILQVSPLAE